MSHTTYTLGPCPACHQPVIITFPITARQLLVTLEAIQGAHPVRCRCAGAASRLERAHDLAEPARNVERVVSPLLASQLLLQERSI